MKECRFAHTGIDVHYIEAGSGMPLLLLHGSGPGASTAGNWRKVLEPLAAHYHVFAMDLIGFGKSGRKPRPPFFDLDLWMEQCKAMLERLPGEAVGILGHSVSGALALKLASCSSKVRAVMTTGCMGAVFAPTPQTETTWTFPKNRDALVAAARNLIHDPDLIDEAYVSNRESVLYCGDYESYFASMFGGDKRRFIDATALSAEELGRIRCNVLMLHGREDRGFPPELSLRIAESLPQADVMLLGRCSHSIAFEFPEKLVAVATAFFK